MDFFGTGLRPRIYGGFGFLIVIAFGLTVFAIWKLSAVGSSVERLDNAQDSAMRALGISNKLQIIRRADLRFIVDGDEESSREATAAESEAIDLLERTSASELSQDRRATYSGIRSEVESLRAKRAELIGLVNDVQAARSRLFTGGDELTAATEQLVNARRNLSDNAGPRRSQVEIEVLLTRVANWRFQATRDPHGPMVFRMAVEQATAEIEALERADLSDAVHKLIAPIKAALAVYASSFESYSTNLLKADELFWKDMTPQVTDIQRRLSTAEASLVQESDAAKTEAFENIAGIITGQESISALALLFGFLIAFVISRSVVKPVSAMTSAMRNLASGDFEVVLPGVDRIDEIGEMARAVEAFKVNAAEKVRLEAREEQARQDRAAAEKRALEAATEADKKAAKEKAKVERRAEMLKLADEFEKNGWQYHRDRRPGIKSTRRSSQPPQQHGQYRPAAFPAGRIGVGGGIYQRPVGCRGDRGDRIVHPRGEPSGS
jgi:HAMP domain-containing protein